MAAVQLLVPELETAQQAAADAARAVEGVRAEQVTVLAPAHISLGYPWRQPPAAATVASIAARLLPAAVGLGPIRAFPADPRGRHTLHVPVLDGGLLQDLATQLGWTGVITPHCSLVRSRVGASLDRARAAAAPFVPATVRLATVEVTAHTDGRWRRVLQWHGDGSAAGHGRAGDEPRS